MIHNINNMSNTLNIETHAQSKASGFTNAEEKILSKSTSVEKDEKVQNNKSF